MSRTDKDAPYWVRVEFYEPVHWLCPNEEAHIYRLGWRPKADRECDLPDRPVRHRYMASRGLRNKTCTWEPVGRWDRKYYTRPPRGRDRQVYFHSPVRRVVRDFCSKARQEFHGTGEVQIVEPGRRPSKLDWWD